MPITQSINSKANVKRFTNNDLPFAVQQPVMSSFYAVSTAGQTVINLSFSVDTVNLTDQFFLFVDGKKLRLGASNDYTFTAIAANGYSSQVTLNQSLVVNLNIQAYNLGLKKESEFNVDNRFVALYAAQGSGFQGFADQTTLITSTLTTGSPAAGTFYSSIPLRASIVDLSQNLKPAMGVERIMTQQIQIIQTEFGPNGEPVWGIPNDNFGQIRFVGGSWSTQTSSYGAFAQTGNVSDYVEIVFYGTGLNLLTSFGGNSSTSYTASVDGAAYGSNLYPVSSVVLGGRNYSPNQIVNVATGLTLGIHTIRIQYANSGSFNLNVNGIEVLNENSTVKVNTGIGYVSGQKLTNSSQSSLSFNSGFTNIYGTAGVKGGHVLVYQSSAGVIQQDIQYTSSQITLPSAPDHTSEELARQYYFREFGAGRADDFSLIASTNVPATNKAFALDDNTTCLSASSIQGMLLGNNLEGFSITSGTFLTFTFVGTGLDIVLVGDGSAYTGNDTMFLDNQFLYSSVARTTIYGATRKPQTLKIASGLPYGTHVFQLTNAVDGNRPHIAAFKVYQPKKPALPSGAVELGDYNLAATFDATNLSNNYFHPPTGTIFKSNLREYNYGSAGTWSIDTFTTSYGGVTGAALNTSNTGSFSYTFEGTGIALQFSSNSGFSLTYNIKIDGTNNASGSVAGGSSNSGGGTYSMPAAGSLSYWVYFTGLTFGTHTITITRNDATAGNGIFDGLYVITPIHSVKSNLYADLQNALPVGNCAISDNRKLTPVKEVLPVTKAWSQARGIQGTITTSTSTLVPMNDMSCVIKTAGGPLQVSWSMSCFSASTNTQVQVQVYIDGAPLLTPRHANIAPTANSDIVVTDTFIVPVAAGVHKVDIYWANGGSNTVSADGAERFLTVKEL